MPIIALIKTAIGAAAGGLFGMIFMRAGTGRVRSILVLLCRAVLCCFYGLFCVCYQITISRTEINHPDMIIGFVQNLIILFRSFFFFF